MRAVAFSIALFVAPFAHANTQGGMVSLFPEDSGGAPIFRMDPATDLPAYTARLRDTARARFESEIRALERTPPRSLRGASSLACIAVAIYHEARGEPLLGQKAVASVILQRAAILDRWGNTPCAVVIPVQFSFMTGRYSFAHINTQNSEERAAWHQALRLAADALIDGPMPELREADHYHANYVSPGWRLEMDHVATIGKHLFYRDPDSHD